MSVNLITGYAGTAHITAAGDGAVNAGMFGSGKYVLNVGEKFGYEVISNNLIRIKSGYAIDQGRKIELAVNDYEEVEIDNGLQGVKRCDLIAITYERNVTTGIETATINVIKGTSSDSYVDPEYTSGNILIGEEKDDFLLYRVKINGLSIEAVEPLFTVTESVLELIAENGKAIDAGIGKLQDNVKEIYEECVKYDDVVGDGSKETVASAAWVRSLESIITTLQSTHKGDVANLQDGINANKKSINSNLDEIKQVRALAEAIQMETFKKTDLTAEVSDSLEFGGAVIGKNNPGAYMVIMFRQSSTYGKDTCSIWSALISSTPENSSAIRILGGGSTSEPSLKVTAGGNLRILGTGTAGATYRGLIFKL